MRSLQQTCLVENTSSVLLATGSDSGRHMRDHHKLTPSSRFAMDLRYGTSGATEDAKSAESKDDDPPKKRRRVVKPNADKKFECKFEGCGKSYSRAEHLYRHQLNHTPKSIYRCDYPDCNRCFVRQDLCIRHRERHTTHGSQLHKRDTFAQTSNAINQQHNDMQNMNDFASLQPPLSPIDHSGGMSNGFQVNGSQHNVSQPRGMQMSNSGISPSTAATEPRFHPPTPHTIMARPELPLHRTVSNSSDQLSPELKQNSASWMQNTRRPSLASADSNPGQPAYPNNSMRYNSASSITPTSPNRSYSMSSANMPDFNVNRTRSDNSNHKFTGFNDAVSTNNYNSNFNSAELTQGGFSRAVSTNYIPSAHGYTNSHSNTYEYNPMDLMSATDVNTAYGFPLFGGDAFSQTPFAAAEDFTNWLFNENQVGSTGFSPQNFLPGYADVFATQLQGPHFSQSPSSVNTYNPNKQVQQAVSVKSLMDSPKGAEYVMSERKRQEILDMMRNQFQERPHDAVQTRKESILGGDIDAEGHILSLGMMHGYINSYWYHQHAQLPILHKPTFSADETPTLLLLAVIAIGAATLDKAYGTALTDSAAEFANFVAWHIRWEIVRDADFRPPAKLWVFQALLLVEVYEKMYATRALHERAHIHHDSTLTLMRRGSSLLGRSASDSPPNINGNQKGSKSSNGGGAAAAEINKSEESWHKWIVTEATRRAAFGAFVLDSIHATMFGHAAKMVAHEMRLPLPCEEGLWSATSPAEVGRVQSLLQSNGIKPTLFLDGLKKTLNGQKVRTNSFGRHILMAGLLSVSWHMTQRDLQITSLGPRTVSSFGGPDKWKGVLLRAFDNWKRDFDEALAESTPPPASPMRNGQQTQPHSVDDENIFESRTVLHHLAHIAAHVDVVDCQVFAGANRLLGRSITPKDFTSVREKIERWATKASARDAAFYALKFLVQVLTPPAHESNGFDGRIYGHASPILPQAFEHNQYLARDDFLLNRPWVLYISALVVWCYGFALEGPIYPRPKEDDFDTYDKRESDMQEYLDNVASVRAPDDLEHISGKNRCLGLLMILKDSFSSTRWELTHEASKLLGYACAKLNGAEGPTGQITMGRFDGAAAHVGQNSSAKVKRS